MFDESYNTKQSTVPMFMLNLSWCFEICWIKFFFAKEGYLIFLIICESENAIKQVMKVPITTLIIILIDKFQHWLNVSPKYKQCYICVGGNDG